MLLWPRIPAYGCAGTSCATFSPRSAAWVPMSRDHRSRLYEIDGWAARAASPIRVGTPGRGLRPRKMRKNGFHRLTAVHGTLTHLIFVRPHPSLCAFDGIGMQSLCR